MARKIPAEALKWQAARAPQMVEILCTELNVTRSAAATLIGQATGDRDGLEFVTQVVIHSENRPAGYHGGAQRWLLHAFVPNPGSGLSLVRLETDVQPQTGGNPK